MVWFLWWSLLYNVVCFVVVDEESLLFLFLSVAFIGKGPFVKETIVSI